MSFVRGAWRLLVGIKDALVLMFLLLFFILVWAALQATPNRAIVPGALLLDFNGGIVEQPAPSDPFALLSGGAPTREYRLSDVVRAVDSASGDARVKAIVLDLDRFTGGGQVALQTVGDALDRARRAGKPVLAYATGYTDDSYQLAAHASEVWMDPMGLAAIAGPGGSQLYFKGLIDRLGITAHIYRVGTFKSAVEPFLRADQSPEARRANEALAGAVWEAWLADVRAARPKAQVALVAADPTQALAGRGSLAEAAVARGLVDKLGDRVQFSGRVAELAGTGRTRGLDRFAAIPYRDWVAANPLPTGGAPIGIATVAGTIIDGQADPGTAGGDSVARYILEAVATKSVRAIVLRIDSPGGSALASERIRQALLEARRQNIPVVASMGSVAASGGYWVSTAAQRVFAEPATITGSIGVFGVIPTLEGALAKIGVTSDGIATTPLSGQPDIFGGTNPAFDALMQSGVEDIYGRFIGIVAQARRLPPARVAEIAEGRVWDGGSARQLGLVDAFGGLDAAMAEAARLAGVDPGAIHPVYLERQPSAWEQALAGYERRNEDETGATDAMTRLVAKQQRLALAAVSEAQMLVSGSAVQARCIECAAMAGSMPAVSARDTASLGEVMLRWLTR